MKRGYKGLAVSILALLLAVNLMSVDLFAAEINTNQVTGAFQKCTDEVLEYDFYEDGSGKNISPGEEQDGTDGENSNKDNDDYVSNDSNQQGIRARANMNVSQNGIDLIKQFEGCRLTAYKATSSEKYYTIGYGHYGPDVYAGMTITQAEAENLLKSDLVTYVGYVNTFLNKYGITVNQNQFDALTSFTYNVGNVWVSYDSFQLKTYLINGVSNYTADQITTAFTNWNKSGGVVLEGLTRRRKAEAQLFLSGMQDSCNCSTSYAGNYICTSNTTLNIRSGHGTGFPVIGSIPSGTTVYVSKADGTWAHVTYNGVSGYASMQYLSRKQESVNVRLHVWVSDSPMGGVPDKYVKGTMYYLCYELLDTSTGKRLSTDHGNMNYTVTETILKPDGSTGHTYQYSNSDNNWIGHTAGQTGTYKGTVTVTGDVGITVPVSWNVVYGGGGTLKTSASSVSLNLQDKLSQTVTLTAGGSLPDSITLNKSVSGSGFTTSWEGNWEGNSHDLKITATGVGSGTITVSLLDADTGDVITKLTIRVTVTTSQYTIKYNANGGSGAPASQTKVKGTDLKLSTAIPKRTGYEFRGWCAMPSAPLAQYLPGATFTRDTDTTLYAVWSPANAVSAFQTVSVNADVPGAGRVYKFVPEMSGTYQIESAGSRDTYVTLYSAGGTVLATNDDGGENRNFLLEYDLAKGTTYYIEARMYSSSITGTFDMEISREIPAVTGLKIGGRAVDALRLNWDKNSGASGYIIEQYKNGGWTRIARIGTNSTTTYRVEGLSASTSCQFRVKAFGFNGSTPLYSSYENISGKTLPTAVTGLKIGGTAPDALRLNWNRNSKASGYIIEQYKNGSWARIARIADNSTVTYRVENLSSSTTYQFRVKAFDFDGSTAIYSAYQNISGTTNSTAAVKAPMAVTGLKIGGRAVDALRLNWDKNSGASGYIIEQYKNGGWTRIARIGTNSTTTYRVEGLSASTSYQFRVQAFGFNGSTPLYSSYKNISGTTLPTAVTGLKIGGTAPDALRLNWNRDSKASGYIIEQYKNGSWVRIARIGTNSTVTYRVEKLQPATTYVFRIQAFGFDGSTPLYSEYQYITGTTN